MDASAVPEYARVLAVALDVDGVLTDGTFLWGPNGEEFKRFSFADIMGISLATKAGILFALISGEDTPLIDRYASKMKIADVYKGCKDKGSAFQKFLDRHGIAPINACFMGDDVNDISAMTLAGLAAAPANANPAVLRFAKIVTVRRGGDGAVRELLDALLAARAAAKTSSPGLASNT